MRERVYSWLHEYVMKLKSWVVYPIRIWAFESESWFQFLSLAVWYLTHYFTSLSFLIHEIWKGIFTFQSYFDWVICTKRLPWYLAHVATVGTDWLNWTETLSPLNTNSPFPFPTEYPFIKLFLTIHLFLARILSASMVMVYKVSHMGKPYYLK